DVDGVWIVGEDGNCEWIGEREDGFGGGVILAEIVEDDGETRAGGRGELERRSRRFGYVNRVGRDIAAKILEDQPFAIFDHAASREFMTRRNIIKGLEDESFVGARRGFG